MANQMITVCLCSLQMHVSQHSRDSSCMVPVHICHGLPHAPHTWLWACRLPATTLQRRPLLWACRLPATTLAVGLPAACDDLVATTLAVGLPPACDDLAATTLAVGLPPACDDPGCGPAGCLRRPCSDDPGCGPAGCLQRPCCDDPCCGPAAWPDASGPPPAPRTGGQSRGRLGQLWQGWDNTGTILGQCWDITGTVLGQYWDSTGMSSLSPQINPKEIECDDFWTRFAGPVSTSP